MQRIPRRVWLGLFVALMAVAIAACGGPPATKTREYPAPSGDRALVVMRLAQWNSVASELTRRRVSLSDAIASGQLTVLDGTRTLARIMPHGSPCRGLFEEVIGKTVRQICAAGARLRVYGDLMDVLAADGNFHGAHELEKMWSDLTRQAPVTVLCGYSAASFHSADAGETLKSICRSHTNTSAARPRYPLSN